MSFFRPALVTCLCASLFIFNGYAQKNHPKSIVSTKMVVLTYKHNDSSSLWDHNDTLHIPVVSDKYPGLRKALAFENIGDDDGLDSVKANYARCSCGLFSMEYEVSFETKDILSISIYTEGMGAYPSSNSQHLTLSISTGDAYPLSNEINAAGREWIYDTYKKLLKKRIAEDYQSRKGEEDNDIRKELNESIDTLTASEMLKDYLFTPSGIMFSTEGVLPHATQAFEPDREWLVSYKQLKRYIAPRSIVVKGAK